MLVVPAILESFASLKDRTLKIVFTTNEVTPAQLAQIAQNIQQFGWIAFKRDMFKQAETDALEGLESGYQDKGKTPSQRLRAVLFVNWNQDHQGYETFEQYYIHETEKIIEHYKSKLDE